MLPPSNFEFNIRHLGYLVSTYQPIYQPTYLPTIKSFQFSYSLVALFPPFRLGSPNREFVEFSIWFYRFICCQSHRRHHRNYHIISLAHNSSQASLRNLKSTVQHTHTLTINYGGERKKNTLIITKLAGKEFFKNIIF